MLGCRRCRDRSEMTPSWLLGSSLGLVTVALVLQGLFGATLYAQALLYAAFPMAALIADPRRRGARLGGLIPAIMLVYAFMLAVVRVADKI